MTPKAEKLRKWLGRAKALHNQVSMYSSAETALQDGGTDAPIYEKLDKLRREEMIDRMEIYDYLKKSTLSVRQHEIINLHYLQYRSWNQIADRMQCRREYCLRVHKEAVERLAGQ